MDADVRRAMGPLTWGTLLVFISIEVNAIDLANDVVGFICVLTGLNRLERATSGTAQRTFQIAICIAGPATIGALACDILAAASGSRSTDLDLVVDVCFILTAMLLARGLRAIALARGETALRDTWNVTFWLLCALVLLRPVLLLDVGVVGGVAGFIAFAVASIHLLMSLARTRRWTPQPERLRPADT